MRHLLNLRHTEAISGTCRKRCGGMSTAEKRDDSSTASVSTSEVCSLRKGLTTFLASSRLISCSVMASRNSYIRQQDKMGGYSTTGSKCCYSQSHLGESESASLNRPDEHANFAFSDDVMLVVGIEPAQQSVSGCLRTMYCSDHQRVSTYAVRETVNTHDKN